MGLAAAAHRASIAVLVALTLLPALLGMIEVQGVRRPGPPLPPAARRATAGSSTTASAGPAWSAGHRSLSCCWSWSASARWPCRCREPAPGLPDRQHLADRHHAAQGLRPDRRRVRPRPRGARCWSSSTAATCRRPTAPRRTTTSVAVGRPARTASRNAQVVRRPTRTGTGAQIMVTPTTGPDETATEDLLTALRDGQAGIEEPDRHDDRRHRPDRDHHRRVRAARPTRCRSTSRSSSGWRSCC